MHDFSSRQFTPTEVGSIEIVDNRLRFRSKYNRALIDNVKRLGMSLHRHPQTKKFMYWQAKASKMFLNNFVTTFPQFRPQLPDVSTPQIDYSSYSFSTYLLQHQHRAAELGVENPRYCFFHAIGCHAPGTKIILANGETKKVEEINVGDKLLGYHGDIKTVSKLHSGDDDMYEVIPVKGDRFIVNKEHILHLQTYKRLSSPVRMDSPFKNSGKPKRIVKNGAEKKLCPSCGEYKFQKEFYKVESGKCRSWCIKCCNQDSRMRSRGIEKSEIDLSIKDYLSVTKFKRANDFKLIRSAAQSFPLQIKNELPIDPYFLGLLIGDGSLGSSTGITTADPEIERKTRYQAFKYGLHIRMHEQPNNKSKTYYLASKIRDSSGHFVNKLSKCLSFLGLRKKNAGSKFIPNMYKRNSVENRWELLAGLIDSDGYVSRDQNYCSITSKSARLVEDICFLARSLGIATYWKEKPVHGVPYYRVHLSGEIGLIPSRLKRKKAKPRRQKKNVLVSGFKIKYVGRGKYYGFELDGDHLYLTEDFTVHHNSGKTLVALEMIKQKQVRTLVLCPLSVIDDAWLGSRGDIQKFMPEIEAVNLWKLKQNSKSSQGFKRYREALHESPVVIINYESFLSIADELSKIDFQMLIVDESARLKDSRAKTTKAVLNFADNMDFCYLLSGLPAPNSEVEYWNQVNCVDPLLFGRSFILFREEYFYSFGYGGFKLAMKNEKRKEFLDKLSGVADVVRPEDVLDLPEPVHSIRRVHLNEQERVAYHAMAKQLYIDFGDHEVIAANAAVKLMKLREGTSGFYLYLDEDRNEKKITRVGHSKLDELKNVILELGGYQAIIWNHFHAEGDQIQELFREMNCTWGRVDGTVPKSVRSDIINRFQDGLIQFLISHPASIGHGNRLENCRYAIYFSLSESYEQYDQSRRRIFRRGQEHQCKFIYLIANGTVDEKIMTTLENKGNVAEAVFRYIKEYRG